MTLEKRLYAGIISLYIFGIIFHILDFTRPYVLQLTTPFLFLTNGAVLFLYLKNERESRLIRMAAIWFVFAVIVTLIIEIIGQKTGQIFGNYRYGNVIWLKVGGVPIVIALNWALIVLCAYSLSNWFCAYIHVQNKLLISIVSALLIVALDYFIEPVAIKLGYWQWQDSLIPFRNYLAWFGIGLLLSFSLQLFKIKIISTYLNVYYLVLIIYFFVLNSLPVY